MPDSVALTCPNCSTRLTIPGEIERFACAACGLELIVHRSGGIVALVRAAEPAVQPVIEPAALTPAAADAASELAMRRLQDEVSALEKQVKKLTPKKGRGFSTLFFALASLVMLISILIFIIPDFRLYAVLGLAASVVIFIPGERLLRREEQKYKQVLEQFNQQEMVLDLEKKEQELARLRENFPSAYR